MSAFTSGQRIAASWLGGPYEPATVLEVSAAGAMMRVRFDDGRETWLAPMNARSLPGGAAASSAPVQSPNPAAAFSPIAPGGSGPLPPAPVAQPDSPPPAATAPPAKPVIQQPFAPPSNPAQSAPAMPPSPQTAPADPMAATQSLPATPASPPSAPQNAAPPPPPSFGEVRPVQGAPIDGANGAMPAGFNPFEPSGGNKS